MLVSPAEGYRLWAATYDSGPNPLVSLEEQMLPAYLPKGYASHILDLGCGTGRWTHRLLACADNVYGIDRSAEMLQKANCRASLQRHLLCADLAALPIKACRADWVLCALSLSYAGNLRQALCEMARVCRSGGRLVITDLHPEAMKAGWPRSFRHGKERYEVEHSRWSLDEITEAAAAAGLTALSLASFTLTAVERELFSQAGKADAFEQWRHVPALWIGVWRKP